MRIVLELKRDAIEDVVLNQLYHHTQMEQTFGVINLAIVDGRPRSLSLKEELQCYIDHRVQVVRRRTDFDLRKARDRLHIVEGLITAVDHLDEVIRLIRHSQTVEEARSGLMSRYLLSEGQANAILSMTLRQLTGLEIEKLRQEQRDLTNRINELEAILASQERILGIIKAELTEMKEKFGDERRTMAACRFLLRQGVFVQGIRPPSVPVGESLLRLSLCHHHSADMIQALLDALAELR